MSTYLDRAKKKVKNLKTENFDQTSEKQTPPNSGQFLPDPSMSSIQSFDCTINILYPLFLSAPECILNNLNIFWQWLPPFISKHDTRFRKCISAAERLALTLALFATGDAQQVFCIYICIYCFVRNPIFSATLLHAFLLTSCSLYNILLLS